MQSEHTMSRSPLAPATSHATVKPLHTVQCTVMLSITTAVATAAKNASMQACSIIIVIRDDDTLLALAQGCVPQGSALLQPDRREGI